jgi:hypothetical protein
MISVPAMVVSWGTTREEPFCDYRFTISGLIECVNGDISRVWLTVDALEGETADWLLENWRREKAASREPSLRIKIESIHKTEKSC